MAMTLKEAKQMVREQGYRLKFIDGEYQVVTKRDEETYFHG